MCEPMIKCVCGFDDDGDDVDEGTTQSKRFMMMMSQNTPRSQMNRHTNISCRRKQETQTHTQKKHTRRINITCETAIVC